eukprot:12579638-Ditylum_brightwellii.AAC.1
MAPNQNRYASQEEEYPFYAGNSTCIPSRNISVRDICSTSQGLLSARSISVSNPKPKYKTELCENFIKYGWCKYKLSCDYAHGEDELRLKTLLERHDAGLLDLETFRTKLCIDHIITGKWYGKKLVNSSF